MEKKKVMIIALVVLTVLLIVACVLIGVAIVTRSDEPEKADAQSKTTAIYQTICDSDDFGGHILAGASSISSVKDNK